MSYLLFLSLLLTPKDTCRENFLNFLLQPPHDNSFFLVVRGKEKGKEVKIVLTTLELSQNLKLQGRTINKKVQQRILKNQVILVLSDSTKYLGRITEQNQFVYNIKEKGKTYFIEYFFDKYGYLKDKLPEQASIESIIEALFNWNILVSESEGNLYVDRKRFCEAPPNLVHELEHHHKNK
jgi:hypothetical protein